MTQEKTGSKGADQQAALAGAEQQQGDQGGVPDRLGPSGHLGQPRMYAENAVDKLQEDPLPETPPSGGTKVEGDNSSD